MENTMEIVNFTLLSPKRTKTMHFLSTEDRMRSFCTANSKAFRPGAGSHNPPRCQNDSALDLQQTNALHQLWAWYLHSMCHVDSELHSIFAPILTQGTLCCPCNNGHLPCLDWTCCDLSRSLWPKSFGTPSHWHHTARRHTWLTSGPMINPC